MGAAPFGDLVGHVGDPGADDEPQPGVLQVGQVRLGQHPGVGDHGHLGQSVRGGERLDHRQDGLGLGRVALERVHLQREPAHIGQQPDGDLRLQPAFLGEPGLAEPVTLVGLEVQRGHVVEHQRRRAQPDMRGARRREPLPPLLGRIAGQPPVDRRIARRGDADLVQHPDRVQLAGRLDQPGQHQRLEHLVPTAGGIEPQAPDTPGSTRPTAAATGSTGSAASPHRLAVTEVEGVLAGVQPLPGDRLQHLHLLWGVRRPDVLDLARPAPVGVHDLHRGRLAGRLHGPDVGHTHRLEGPD